LEERNLTIKMLEEAFERMRVKDEHPKHPGITIVPYTDWKLAVKLTKEKER